ncbi:MAG: peptidylprolyl isomerase [Candidatus Omnitrophota bacterium]|nr:peptidylprolyl isomerase [Candidatus Omnitrophota bacterium]
MRAYLRILSVFIIAIGCLAVCGQASGFGNKILVVVNDEVITQVDLDVALTPVTNELKKEFSGDELKAKIEETRDEILNQMVEDKLILQEAKRRGVVVDESEIDERLKDVEMRFPSTGDFNDEVEKIGLTITILRIRYKEQLMMAKLVTHEIKDKVVVTPAEISDYYDKHPEEFGAPESVHLKNIMIRFDEATTELLAKQKADDVYRLIKEGRDFSDLAKQYSQGAKADEGGDLGFIPKGQMREEFDKVIFALKAGEASPPIKTDTGYYIFKVEEKKDAYSQPLSEVRDNVENTIFREKAQKRYKEWIAKLKRDAFIQFK